MLRRSQRAHDLVTAREIGEMVLDLLAFVLVAAVALSMRECEPLNQQWSKRHERYRTAGPVSHDGS